MGLFGKNPKVPATISKRDRDDFVRTLGAQVTASDSSNEKSIRQVNAWKDQQRKAGQS